jgi:CheY-like chemotaxis protein
MSALRKVLVVDDDPVVGKSFKRVLSGKGYIVVTAEDGYDALQKLQSETYDAVFTDLRMPGMNGLEVAERIKARQPWTPVVIVTGYGSKTSEERARAAGVSDFLHKPLSPEMIEDSAAKAMLWKAPQAAAPEAQAVPAAAPAEPEVVGKYSMLKNMVLFLSAPFVGLLYAVLLPFVGLGMLAWIGGKALLQLPATREALNYGKFMLKMVAAPFVGLAYIIVFPFVGLAMLAWHGGKALIGIRPAE